MLRVHDHFQMNIRSTGIITVIEVPRKTHFNKWQFNSMLSLNLYIRLAASLLHGDIPMLQINRVELFLTTLNFILMSCYQTPIMVQCSEQYLTPVWDLMKITPRFYFPRNQWIIPYEKQTSMSLFLINWVSKTHIMTSHLHHKKVYNVATGSFKELPLWNVQ